MLTTGSVRALGLMSGTSLDGVDAAVIETDGIDIHGFGETAYHPYSEKDRTVLRSALGCWPGDAPVEAATEVVELAHVEVISRFRNVALAGFHGQTLAHDPGGRGTHQVGNGAALAEVLKLSVAWDFRSLDVAGGGQGAPLAPVYHFALAKWIGAEAPVAFLNLGGVGNVTWVDPTRDAPEDLGALLAFDTGPANAPINDFMRTRRGKAYDKRGALAACGEPDAGILERFLDHPYFKKAPPKSLDRDDFSRVLETAEVLPDADAAATLTAAAAESVLRSAAFFPAPVSRLLVTGGGRHNPVMMDHIRRGMECPVEPVEAAGLDGDMLEAQAFAYLAVRVARGLPTSFPGTTGIVAPVCGGRISTPGE